MGVHFWTPGELRRCLLKHLAPSRERLLLREDLRILATAAFSGPDRSPAERATARDPDAFLAAWDALIASGRGARDLPERQWRAAGDRFEQSVYATGRWSAQQADRALAGLDADFAAFGPLLTWGFSAADWAFFPLLKTAVNQSARAIMILPAAQPAPRDEAWTGTWEQTYGEAQLLPPATEPGPFTPLARRFEESTRGYTGDTPPVAIHIARNPRAEAEAIVTQTLRCLAGRDAGRVGVVVPRGSVLAREVAAELARLEIPHHDTLGFFPAQPGRQNLLNLWTNWQRDPFLTPFVEFIEGLNAARMLSPEDAAGLHKILDRTFGETLTDELPVIREYLRESEPAGLAATFFRNWQLLPDEAVFGEFFDASRTPLDQLGWRTEYTEQLLPQTEALISAMVTPIPREAFAQWLADVLRTPGRARHFSGRASLAPVQIVDFARARGQSWDHLILAGLNRGSWPPEEPDEPFLPEDYRQQLNEEASREGRQGDGHITLADGFGYVSGPAERRSDADAAILELIENVTTGLTLTASRFSVAGASRETPPSEYLARLTYACQGRLPDDKALDHWEHNTLNRLAAMGGYPRPTGEEEPTGLMHTQAAYHIRRDPRQPFGEYEFAFREPPEGGLQFGCDVWENVMRRPATVWFAKILNIESRDDYEKPAEGKRVRGVWVHRWLQLKPSQVIHNRPAPNVWQAYAKGRAKIVRERVHNAYTAADRALPDWWTGRWAEARAATLELIHAVEQGSDWPALAAEVRLPDPSTVVAGEFTFPVAGRIDLLLVNTELRPGETRRLTSETAGPFWIVDFKTGRTSPLKTSKLEKGEGIQIALYALSLPDDDVTISLLTPKENLKPQMHKSELLELMPVWSALAATRKNGILGMHGPIRNAYAFAGRFPTATLPVDPAILKSKWDLTHPGLENAAM